VILVDTDVVSGLRRLDRANASFAAWARSTRFTDLCISVITFQELETGVLLVARRDPAQGKMLRDCLDNHFLENFADVSRRPISRWPSAAPGFTSRTGDRIVMRSSRLPRLSTACPSRRATGPTSPLPARH
jgi:hypothetical protein